MIRVNKNVSDTAAEEKPSLRGIQRLADVDCSLLLCLRGVSSFSGTPNLSVFFFLVFRLQVV